MKIKTYKNVKSFTKKVLELDDYESWLITLKNKLIKLIVDTRKKNDLSQSDLAKLAGTTQSVISRIESGTTRNITIDYLLKIVSILGVSPRETLKRAA